MSRILDLIEQEMTVFDAGDVTDFNLLQEVLDYYRNYPESSEGRRYLCSHSITVAKIGVRYCRSDRCPWKSRGTDPSCA
jgi:hypothetical protein